MARLSVTHRILLILCVVVGLTFFAWKGLVHVLLYRAIPAVAEEKLGLLVSYDKASWELLSGLTFTGVAVQKKEAAPSAIEVNAERIDLSYRPKMLFTGLDHFVGGILLSASRVDVRVDLPARPEADPGEPGLPEINFPSLPQAFPSFRLDRASVTVRHGEDVYRAGEIEAAGSPDGEGGARIDVKISGAAMVRQGEETPFPLLSTRIEYEPNEFRLPFLDLDVKRIAEQGRVSLTSGKDALGFSGGIALLGGRVSGSGKITDKNVSFSGEIDFSAPPVEFLPHSLLDKNLSPGSIAFSVDGILDRRAFEQSAGTALLEMRGWKYGGVEFHQATTKIVLHDGLLDIDSLKLETSKNRFSAKIAKVPFLLLKTGDYKQMLTGAEGEIAFRSESLREFEPFFPREAVAHLKAAPDHFVELNGEFAQGRVLIGKGIVKSAGGEAILHKADLPIPGVREDWLSQPVDISGKASFDDPALLSVMPALPRLEGEIRADIRVKGSFASPSGSVLLHGDRVKVGAVPLGRIHLAGTADGQRAVIEEFSALRGTDTMKATAEIDLAGRTISSLRASCYFEDIAVYTNFLFDENPFASGRLSASINGRGAFADPVIDGEVLLRDLSLKGVLVRESNLKGEYAGKNFRFENVSALLDAGLLTAAGNLQLESVASGRTLHFDSLSFEKGEGRLSLVEPGSVTLLADGIRIDDHLTATDGIGTVRLKGGWQVGAGNFSLNGSDVSGEKWFPAKVKEKIRLGGFSFDMEFKGTLEAPSVNLSGRVAELASPDFADVLSGTLDLHYGNGGLLVKEVDFASQGKARVRAQGSIPLLFRNPVRLLDAPLDFKLDFRIPDVGILPGAELYVRDGGELTGDVVLEGTWEHPRSKVRVRGENLVAVDKSRLLPEKAFSFDCDFSAGREMIELRSLRVNSEVIDFFASGEWRGRELLGILIQERRIPDEGVIRLKSGVMMESMAWLSEKVYSLRHLKGKLEAETDIIGPPRNLVATLSAWLSEGDFRPAPALPAMRDIAMSAVIGKDSLQLKDLQGTLGGAPFVVSGVVGLGNWRPERVDLRLQGENLLFHRSQGIKIRGNADLELSGAMADLYLKGAVRLSDGIYSKPFDPLGYFLHQGFVGRRPPSAGGKGMFSFTEEPLKSMRLAVRLETEEPFLVQNNVVKGSFRSELMLTGTGELPVLQGEVYVDPARVTMPSGRLNVESGILRFLPGQPDLPLLNLQASSKMRGYDISLLVEGAVDEPVVTLSSVPPLPNDELVLLLLTGRVPQNGVNKGAYMAQAGVQLVVFLGKGFLVNWYGKDAVEVEESILDRFELNIGQEITKKGDTTIEAQFRLADNVIMNEDALYLMTEKDAYDDFNAGLRLVFRFR